MRHDVTIRGPADNPLVVAFHGAAQLASGAMIPYFDFARMSQLPSAVADLAWSLYMPQSPTRNWSRARDGRTVSLVDDARKETGSTGPLILAGFSDGATLLHRIAGSLDPVGLLVYSGLFRGPAADVPSTCRVAIVTDEGDPTFPTSVIEAGNRAYEAYKGNGVCVRRWERSLGRHHWDPTINQEVFRWLTQG